MMEKGKSMRFIPRTKVVQERLDLSIMSIDKAIEKLSRENFTGYCTLSFPNGSEVVMVFRNGRTSHYYCAGPDKLLRGPEAKEELSDLLTGNQGHLDIVELNDNALQTLLSLLYGKNAYGSLDSEYVNFPGLLEHLLQEKSQGVLSLHTDDDDVLILIGDGKPRSIYFRGIHIKKGDKADILKLVSTRKTVIEFFHKADVSNEQSQERQRVIGQEKDTLHLQKLIADGETWFEDQYGNRYRKDQIQYLWDKYNIIL